MHGSSLYGNDDAECFEEASSSASSDVNPNSAWDTATRIGLDNELGG